MVKDDAILRDPEGMREHQRIRDEEEENNPKERRKRNGGFVKARVHRQGFTGIDAEAGKTNSHSPERGPFASTRARRVGPFAQASSRSSVEPLKNCWRMVARNFTASEIAGASMAKEIHSGRSEKSAGPSGRLVENRSDPHSAKPERTSPRSTLVWPMNWAA